VERERAGRVMADARGVASMCPHGTRREARSRMTEDESTPPRFDPIAALRALGHEVTLTSPEPVTGHGSRTVRKGWKQVSVRIVPAVTKTFSHFAVKVFDGPTDEAARAYAVRSLCGVVEEILRTREGAATALEQSLAKAQARVTAAREAIRAASDGIDGEST
jgi:hypothetical protein